MLLSFFKICYNILNICRYNFHANMYINTQNIFENLLQHSFLCTAWNCIRNILSKNDKNDVLLKKSECYLHLKNA